MNSWVTGLTGLGGTVIGASIAGIIALVLDKRRRVSDERVRQDTSKREDHLRAERDRREDQIRAQQLTLETRKQWDRDVVRIAGELVAIAERLLPVANRYWSYYHYATSVAADKDFFDTAEDVIEADLRRQSQLVTEIRIVTPEAAQDAQVFHQFCVDSFQRYWSEVVDQNDQKHYIPNDPDPPSSIADEVTAFISAVHRALRLNS